MFRLWTIAQREFTAMVGTKAFLLTLIMMPILALGGIVLMPALSKIGGNKTRKILVADGSGWVLPLLQSASDQRTKAIELAGGDDDDDNPFEAAEFWTFEATDSDTLDDQSRLLMSDQIRAGEIYAFIEIPPGFNAQQADSAAQIQFVSQDSLLSSARRWVENLIQSEVRTRRLKQLGIDPQLVAQANVAIQLEAKKPFKQTDGKIDDQNQANIMVTMMLPFGVMMLMFMVIFLAAQPMLESGMEEKNQRIAELLLGSVSPMQLMTGKLLGNVAGSFVVFAVYGIGGSFVIHSNDWDLELPLSMMPWLIIFQILGVLFFSSIFLTIGAAVSELKEAQSMLLPVWLVLMLPMMIWFVAVRDPNGTLAVSLSFFPPSTPMMMSLRMAAGQTIPIWQAPAAAVTLLAATFVVVTIASRIYRASLLKSDSAKTLVQLFHRLRAAE